MAACQSSHIGCTPAIAHRRVPCFLRHQRICSILASTWRVQARGASEQTGGESISFPSRFDDAAASGTARSAAPRLPLQPNERQPGEVVAGRYTVLSTLGEGSSSITYAAAAADGARVAVKELALSKLKNWKQFDLFEREAAMLRSLNHPSIPRYVEYVEAEGSFFLVQELADGITLQQLVQGAQQERFDEDEVQRIARSLLETVGYLSSRRPAVVHRDIKPENVVIEGGRAGGRVLLVDFGGVQDALALDANVMGSTIIGTAGYMAPEHLRGAATPASDMYSLGALLLFALSGRRPQQFRTERLRLNFSEVVMSSKMRTLLQGLLDPIAEDRLSPQQALDVLDGKALDTAQATSQSGWLGRQPQPDARVEQYDPYGAYRIQPPSGSPSWRRAPTSKPKGCPLVVDISGETLTIDNPPKGLSGPALSTGGFALLWNALVGVWTVSAVAGGGVVFGLFSLPFWFAGSTMAREALELGLARETFQMDATSWSLSQDLAYLSGGLAKIVGKNKLLSLSGSTQDFDGCRVVTTIDASGQPCSGIELLEGGRVHQMGYTLTTEEQEWLVGVINRHAEQVAGPVTVDNAVNLEQVVQATRRSTGVPEVLDRPFDRFDSWDD